MEDIYRLDSTGIAAQYKQEQYLKEAAEYRLRLSLSPTRNPWQMRRVDTQLRPSACCTQEGTPLHSYI